MSERLSTGGGYGYLSGEHGLVIDNIVQATVVTADGSVLTASANQNPDLFYGIRGGGSNFGIVIEFVYKLHEQKNKVYGGLMIFGEDKMEAVAEELVKWWPTATPKETINCLITRLPQNHEVDFFFAVVVRYEADTNLLARDRHGHVLQRQQGGS